MSETLFGLVGEYRELYEMLIDADESEKEVIEDTLEAVTGAIEVKGAGYVSVLNQLDMEIEACKKQKAEWDARLKARENAQKRLKQHLLDGLLLIGKNEIKAGDVTIKVQNAGGKLPIVFDSEKKVPEKFTKITIETDNNLVRAALEAGEKLDFAHFGERTKILKIR